MKTYLSLLLVIFLAGCGQQLPTKEEMIPLINKRVAPFGHEVIDLTDLKCKYYWTGTSNKDYECNANMKFSDGDSINQTFQLDRSSKGQLKLYAVGRM